jgi:fibro-slime domain-containing protein
MDALPFLSHYRRAHHLLILFVGLMPGYSSLLFGCTTVNWEKEQADASSAGKDGDPGSAITDSHGGKTDPEQQSCGNLIAIVRDFKKTHPDMETYIGDDRPSLGIVEAHLGADGKPVYAQGDKRAKDPKGDDVISGKSGFNQWYRDIPGVNQKFEIPITFRKTSSGTDVFENNDFFPVDQQGFGNEGNAHNFHFTTEIHTTFKYQGGERFTFKGDDDVFVFINKRLALDLGGTHRQVQGTIDFDAKKNQLGLVVGNTYTLDVFHAERHTFASHFRIETTIACMLPLVD